MNESAAAIIDAAYLPLSIIIIGIGNADFGKMEYLDGDDGLIDNAGRKAKRDLVQFVPFNKYKGNPAKLAESVLEELPTQLCEYMRMVGIKPDPPQVVDINNMKFSMQGPNNPGPTVANFGKNMANAGFMANIINQEMNPNPIGYNQPPPMGMPNVSNPGNHFDNPMNPAPFGMGQQAFSNQSPQNLNYSKGYQMGQNNMQGQNVGYAPNNIGYPPQQQQSPQFGQGQRPLGQNTMAFGQNFLTGLLQQQQNQPPPQYQQPGKYNYGN